MKPLSHVQFVDLFLQRIAIGVLLVSVGYALEVGEYVFGPSVYRWLRPVEMGISVAVVIVILPYFLKYIRHRRVQGKIELPEGYVSAMFRRSCARSFEITFIFLIAAEFISHRILNEVPAKIFLDATLFVTLSVMSLTFLSLNWPADEDDELESGIDL